MARLQTTGPISVTNINSLKGLGTAQTSLEARDKQYMGSANPAAPKTSGVCMPEEDLDQNDPPTKAVTTTPWTWSNTTGDPAYNSQTWGPHKMSEFYGAYNGIPATTITTVGVGPGGVTTGWTTICKINLVISGEVGTGPWAYWVESNGGFSTGWVTGVPAGPVAVNGGANIDVGANPATITAYVRDNLNCGASKEISYTGTYP